MGDTSFAFRASSHGGCATPRWSFFQPRVPRPPCFAAAHSPSPTPERPVLSTIRCSGLWPACRASRRRVTDSVAAASMAQASRPARIAVRIDRTNPPLTARASGTQAGVSGGLDREVREPWLPARSTGRRNSSGSPGIREQPQRQVAPPDQGARTPPLPNPTVHLVRRLHPRRHPTIMRRAPSTRHGSTAGYHSAVRNRAPTPPSQLSVIALPIGPAPGVAQPTSGTTLRFESSRLPRVVGDDAASRGSSGSSLATVIGGSGRGVSQSSHRPRGRMKLANT
ncbi:hypothetical protein LuPra_00879 [Luteitalea pratensis]|uniref:Uncharacterized protein n=1 Tax=Luteitalea pratensis TaxID=1855912 RepID=A0A143PGQ6_LUTPR|nr:hypothetical protein LuPra_00879 [Luteitalea pratensis]